MAVEASGEQTKMMLAQILKRLDDIAALSKQRYEEQAAFNAQVSQDLQACRKQIDLTQGDVDEVRQAASAARAAYRHHQLIRLKQILQNITGIE
ncbi:hypothetical protein QYE76_007518 [Lolium multiflorum]|uniref:Uncharacterized protein n=1 Tax=Lolium multiflorum TaxID=4521 RepID=A0AAD8PIL6_LOLMU|nr:hypothetical protein QYE76_007518 [Lolium multiflorum]